MSHFYVPLISPILNICHLLDQLDIPICDGCGSRNQECWETCQEENGDGNERGFCEKCNSYVGVRDFVGGVIPQFDLFQQICSI